jgi:transketolase
MRDAFAEVLGELSEERNDLYLITSDISPASKLHKFVNNLPDRVIDAGISEQLMIGMASGLAMQGFKVFAYTIANFSLFRPFEQLRIDLSYQNLPVTVVGVGAGLSYSALGYTHHSPDDVGVISNLPNFNIITPSDPIEVKNSVRAILDLKTPSYLRLGKSGEPNLTSRSPDDFKLGICRRIKSNNDFKNEVSIVTYGPILDWVIDITAQHDVDIYNVTSIVPFPKKDLENIFGKYRKVMIIEEHFELTGLSSIIKNKINPDFWKDKIIPCGLNFSQPHNYGTQEDVRNFYGLTKEKVLKSLISEEFR